MTTRTTRAGSRATSSTNRDLTAEITYLTRALKAPTMREAVTRLAERDVGRNLQLASRRGSGSETVSVAETLAIRPGTTR